jgi:hypothetical protein
MKILSIWGIFYINKDSIILMTFRNNINQTIVLIEWINFKCDWNINFKFIIKIFTKINLTNKNYLFYNIN